jgi:hypothetical protein
MKKYSALAIVLTLVSLTLTKLHIVNHYCSLGFSRGYDLLVTAPAYFSHIPLNVPGLF